MPELAHDSSQRCLIYAHRGANTEAMENTRRAFDKALHYAIDGIETDGAGVATACTTASSLAARQNAKRIAHSRGRTHATVADYTSLWLPPG